MRLATWPIIRKSLPTHIQREFRGVNKLDAFSIGEQYATDIKNLTSKAYPAMTVRPGFSLIGSAFPAALRGVGVWKDTELHAVANGVWSKWNGSAWTTLASGLNTSAMWSFTNFKGNLADIGLIATNGVDPIKVYVSGSVSNLATAPAGGNFIEAYEDRLYCAVGQELRFSAYRMANDWTTVDGEDTDAGYITVETPSGEAINGLRAGIGHVTIFKPSSIHELFGSSPSDYRVIPVTTEVGIINHNCSVVIGGIMYILDNTGIYRYAGGTPPRKDFSAPVQWYVDNMNAAAKQYACVGTDGKRLFVALPIESSTAPDTILEYDPDFGFWYVYKDASPLVMAKWQDTLVVGENSGKVRKLSGTTDDGAPITWHWVSKPFGSGSMNQKIRWYRMWLVVDVPVGSSINVYLSPSASGDNDWVLVKSITGNLQSVRIPIIPSQIANSNWIRLKLSGTGPVTIYEIDREQQELPII